MKRGTENNLWRVWKRLGRLADGTAVGREPGWEDGRNLVEWDNIGLHGYGERGAKHERVNRYLWK